MLIEATELTQVCGGGVVSIQFDCINGFSPNMALQCKLDFQPESFNRNKNNHIVL